MKIIVREDTLNRVSKSLLTENRELILEDVQGLDVFLNSLKNRFPELEKENFLDLIRNFIENSNCQRIEFAKFDYPAIGLSLSNGVLINKDILTNSYFFLSKVLYVIFHEIAHQYQYKKYGYDIMQNIYHGNTPLEDGVKLLKSIEYTADQFGMRKCREFAKLGFLDPTKIQKTMGYDKFTDKEFEKYINDIKRKVVETDSITEKEISTMMWNWVKAKEN
jgi:hypothetical protein